MAETTIRELFHPCGRRFGRRGILKHGRNPCSPRAAHPPTTSYPSGEGLGSYFFLNIERPIHIGIEYRTTPFADVEASIFAIPFPHHSTLGGDFSPLGGGSLLATFKINSII